MNIMRRVIVVLGILVLGVLAISVALADEHHAKVALVPVGGSGVTGFVQLEQIPSGGTNIHVVARGLRTLQVSSASHPHRTNGHAHPASGVRASHRRRWMVTLIPVRVMAGGDRGATGLAAQRA